jgi:hypothetical protein
MLLAAAVAWLCCSASLREAPSRTLASRAVRISWGQIDRQKATAQTELRQANGAQSGARIPNMYNRTLVPI